MYFTVPHTLAINPDVGLVVIVMLKLLVEGVPTLKAINAELLVSWYVFKAIGRIGIVQKFSPDAAG